MGKRLGPEVKHFWGSVSIPSFDRVAWLLIGVGKPVAALHAKREALRAKREPHQNKNLGNVLNTNRAPKRVRY